MGDLINVEGNELVKLLHTQGAGLAASKPFERDIFLFATHIAGTSFIEGLQELEPHLQIGDKLNFFREPDNPYDNKAIVIKNLDGIKIGYVPKEDNVVFSRLLDAGKLLFGQITAKKLKGTWLKITIDIFLHG